AVSSSAFNVYSDLGSSSTVTASIVPQQFTIGSSLATNNATVGSIQSGGAITINGSNGNAGTNVSLSTGQFGNSTASLNITEAGPGLVTFTDTGSGVSVTPAELVALIQVSGSQSNTQTLNIDGTSHAATGGTLSINASNIPASAFTNFTIP